MCLCTKSEVQFKYSVKAFVLLVQFKYNIKALVIFV